MKKFCNYMFEKFWDKEKKYIEGFLKEYKYWLLEVSYRQHTLGCYIVFCKREVERISELTPEEIGELPLVLKEIEEALTKNETFKPDRFNYWQMGNGLHQLHIHGFPRYSTPRFFFSREWIDAAYGHPPVWSKEGVGHDLVREVREAIKKYLPV